MAGRVYFRKPGMILVDQMPAGSSAADDLDCLGFSNLKQVLQGFLNRDIAAIVIDKIMLSFDRGYLHKVHLLDTHIGVVEGLENAVRFLDSLFQKLVADKILAGVVTADHMGHASVTASEIDDSVSGFKVEQLQSCADFQIGRREALHVQANPGFLLLLT